MTHFSFAQVLEGALASQKRWPAYGIVIVSAGGHVAPLDVCIERQAAT